MVVTNNEINATKKAGKLTTILMTMRMRVQRGAHCPIKHIIGFTRRHWMPPLGKCSHRSTTAATMVNDFSRKHKTLT
jgi:hypothetical protein